MRKFIVYWSGGIPALHVKLWTEQSSRKQIGVDAPHAVTGHLGEKIGLAVFAPVRGPVFRVKVSVSPRWIETDEAGCRLQAYAFPCTTWQSSQ